MNNNIISSQAQGGLCGATSTISSIVSDGYGQPCLISHFITEDSIQFIYRRDPNYTYTSTGFPVSQPYPLIYKDVYKAVDGKIKKVETILGKYVPASQESYEF